LNRKTKKRIKIVAVVLFFFIAGIGYFIWNRTAMAKKESVELAGVLALEQTDTAEKAVPSSGENTGEEASEISEDWVIYVCGAVNSPGIYVLKPGSRLYEAIAMADGFSAEADPSYHNLARSISDGERIYIVSSEETKELTAQQQVLGEQGADKSPKESGLINLNTATAEQLTELPGIGEAKAAGILEYRARIGQFTAIEEIKNVSGIGEAMYEKIKDKITVK